MEKLKRASGINKILTKLSPVEFVISQFPVNIKHFFNFFRILYFTSENQYSVLILRI